MTANLSALVALAEGNPQLHAVLRLLAEEGVVAHLVGGCVRDALLGTAEIHDFDFVLERDALRLAVLAAERLQASYVPLDVERGIARVVHAGEVYDFADYQKGSLEEDLRARDLTINAMAVEAQRLLDGEPVLADPTNGLADLQAGVVRCPSPQVLDEDPLRLLRVVRFAAVLRFRVDDQTLAALPPRVGTLDRVAGERVRDELFKILQCDSVEAPARLLAETGLLGDTSLLVALEGVLESHNPAIGGLSTWLREELVAGRSRRSLLRLCAIAKFSKLPDLRLSRVEEAQARKAVEVSHEPLAAGPRELRRLFDKAGEGAVLGVLLRQARAPSDAELATAALRWYFGDARLKAAPLLNGTEVAALLGLPPGPRIGEILGLLADAQAEGRVGSRLEAETFVQELV